MASAKSYLRSMFDNVAFEQAGESYSGKIIGLYQFNIVSGTVWGGDVPDDLMNKDFEAEGSVVQIRAVTAEGASEEEAANALLERMILEEHFFLAQGNGAEELPESMNYMTISEDDPLHTHGQHLLMDFRGVVFTDDDELLIDGEYGDYHAHLLREDSFWDRVRNEL